jgi:hypothetical protein
LFCAAVSLLPGCAINMKIPVKDPVPSSAQYVKPAGIAPVALFFTDARTPESKTQPITGRIPMHLTTVDHQPFDAISWLADNTVKELVARGLPVQRAADAAGANTVIIKRISIETGASADSRRLKPSRA